jgi:hypothetical protein
MSEENPLLRRLDNILAEPAFDELLNLCVDSCLTAPGRFDSALRTIQANAPKTQESTEAVLLRKLGLWGARTSLEFSSYQYEFDLHEEKAPGGEEKETADNILRADTPITDPEIFSSSQDIRIAHKIEALGKAILDEAFVCLGDDAFDKVTLWRQAKTKDEKRIILNWLYDRVAKFYKKPEGEGQDESTNEAPAPLLFRQTVPANINDNYFYHPIRLSPRAYSQFPDARVSPTCLGKSILVASFLEKAGTPYLHCGVAESTVQAARSSLAKVIDISLGFAKELGTELPMPIAYTLALTAMELKSLNNTDIGIHAAVAVAVSDTKWVMLDTNYELNVLASPSGSEMFSRAYKDLEELHDLTPGTESMLLDYNVEMGCKWGFVALADGAEKSESLSDIDDFLKTCDDYENPTYFLKRFVEPLIEDSKGPELWYDEEPSLYQTILQVENIDDFRQLLINNVILKYVFSDAEAGDISQCLARCKYDEEYRRRRVQDLKLAPLYAVGVISNVLAQKVISKEISAVHPKVEVGLARYRVGATILNDFAANCGDDLPLSFWLTYWPSLIALTDHFKIPEDVPQQQSMAHNHAGRLLLTNLKYISKNGILKKFLEYEQKGEDHPLEEGGDKEDGFLE